MRRTFQCLAIGVLALSSTAAAQSKPQTRDGFTISFGLGVGSATATCTGCGTLPRETGGSGYLRVGGALSQTLVLGAESDGWRKVTNGVDVQHGSLMGVAQWYPSPTGGFYLKGGAGVGAYSESDGTYTLEAVGPAYQGGVGYDLRVGSNFSLTPYVNYLGMGDSKIRIDGATTTTDMRSNNFQYGIGFTWH